MIVCLCQPQHAASLGDLGLLWKEKEYEGVHVKDFYGSGLEVEDITLGNIHLARIQWPQAVTGRAVVQGRRQSLFC